MGLYRLPKPPRCLGAQISYVLAEISIDLDKQGIGHTGWEIACPHGNRTEHTYFRAFNLHFCPMCMSALCVQLGLPMRVRVPDPKTIYPGGFETCMRAAQQAAT